MSYSMKTFFYLLAGAEHRQQQGTTSLINKHLHSIEVLLECTLLLFCFNALIAHWTHENEWVESYCLDSWLNAPIESFHEPIPTCHFVQFRILLVCVFLFSNWICVGAGPFSSIWLQQKNTHKTSLLFRTTRHIIISCISLMMNNSCDLRGVIFWLTWKW